MKIPKIFHRIWLGPNKLPSKSVKYGRTWEKHHPDWEMKLWTDDNMPNLINEKYLPICTTYSEMSDLIRYELLYRFGGVYIDTDFSDYKNIEPLIQDKDIFVSSESRRILCGGIIGSSKKHPLIKRVIDKIPEQLINTTNSTSDLRIGPTFLTNTIDYDEINVLPTPYFYPYLPGQNHLKRRIKKDGIAYAAHHWHASWLKTPKINNHPIENLSIIIPYKENDNFRKNNFNYVRNRYEELFPEAEIIIGNDTSKEAEFCRSHSINDGVKRSHGDILLISDGDVIIRKEAVRMASDLLFESPFIIPWGKCYDLNRKISRRIIKGKKNTENEMQQAYNEIRNIIPGESTYGDKVAGGCQVITKNLFNKIGGYSEKFKKWGWEDTDFCYRIKKEIGDYYILPDENIYHLFHPRPMPNNENKKLFEKNKRSNLYDNVS